MNNKIAFRIGLGVFLYAVFVAAVLNFYPDKPENMDWKDREEYNKVQVSKLELGLTKQAILELMGSPDISEAKRNGDKELQVMFYRTQHKQADGITTQDECTPLFFVNGTLVGWGDSAYQNYLNG